MRVKNVSLIQINNSFSGQNYLPYSAAILATYFKFTSSACDQYYFNPYIYKRANISTILAALENTDVLGLSLYAWNTNLSLEVAKRFKTLNPNALIFAGGPSVPDLSEGFLRRHHFIDIALHNEGEVSMKILLEEFIENKNFFNVPSASFIYENNYITTDRAPRIKDLSTIPSPFLSGGFESLFKQNPNENWIGLWETNRGCPFTCTYCDWGSATGSKIIGVFPEERLQEEMNWFSTNKIEFIFCCDANFGMFSRDPKIARMAGLTKERTGYPHALSVQNTKNSTDRSYETQKILCDFGLNKGVTLSMQTMSDEALKNIKRSNIRLSSYFELQKRFKSDGVPTYSDLILALPGETYDSYLSGMCKLIESGQHNRIQFNNLSILPNAEIARPEERSKYGIKTVISDIVNMHGSLCEEDELTREKQELVIETASLSASDWRKVRSLSWLTAFLYFDKIAQVPLVIVNSIFSLPISDILDSFVNISTDYPLLNSLISFLDNEAMNISRGSAEYIHSATWLDIYWPVDEYLFIDYCTNNKLKQFYSEISSHLFSLVNHSNNEYFHHIGPDASKEIINESVNFNHWLLNTPFSFEKSQFSLSFNIDECYSSHIEGCFVDLTRNCRRFMYSRNSKCYTDLNDWLREVVWYGNKRGSYLRSFDIIK
ncbi:Radical SAM superfamily protein [Prochlorococcus marinus str. MIT 1342]|uniref:B12-binding domain-containing radical SAM protein n=1 Tax=Prochlorococcus TaxID=1218 RepID=UPI0007B3C18A|nr:B12-binding domain-containing radical SAM protein [Prochlorococcus marinus]KZR79936.1 Radical SAM superfamily protein [Prochlorococcus marinus str. MIT 1342]